MNTLADKYNELSSTYDDIYVEGGYASNPYMHDEFVARMWFIKSTLSGSVISLGCGTGQDFEITNHPAQFTGYDVSSGMLAKARVKFPAAQFIEHDCNVLFDNQADILVSMFGAPNYIGAERLQAHYENLKCKHAFFIFYNELYEDGITTTYHRYTKPQLMDMFANYSPVVDNLWDKSNYYVVYW